MIAAEIDEINAVNSDEGQLDETGEQLVEVNLPDLNQESLALINQIIAENDIEKTKDLTYLFNVNQNKKTMVRLDKLSTLQDELVEQFSKRVHERPNEISNQDLMQALKLTQDILERGQKQVSGINDTPLIQINQQTNTVNVGDKPTGLTRDSRERVKNAVLSLLSGLAEPDTLDDQDVIISQDTLTDDETDDLQTETKVEIDYDN